MNNLIAEHIVRLVVLLLSLTVHEWAHAWTAWRLGDDTAQRLGRLTLDPIAHIDPIGALLPLFGAPVGWARPVPVNPAHFTVDTRLGMMLTAAAGPASNLLLALGCALALAGLRQIAPAFIVEWGLAAPLELAVLANVLLAAFNLLPIPPLDGSRIVEWQLPSSLRPVWDQLQGVGWLLVVGVVVIFPFVGIDLLIWPTRFAVWLIAPA